MLKSLLYISLGASLGATSRYLISKLLQQWSFLASPFISTFAVNILGSLLLGIWLGSRLGKEYSHSTFQLFLVVGFLGSLTTFSAFSKDFFYLASDSLIKASLIAASQVSLGILAFGFAFRLGERLFP